MKTKLELRKDIITSLSNESLGAVMGGSYSECNMTNEENGCGCGWITYDECYLTVDCRATTMETENSDCNSPGDANSSDCGSPGDGGAGEASGGC